MKTMICDMTLRRWLRGATAVGILLLLGATVTTAFAQGRGKIEGTVTDARTGEALPGVNVVIAGTTIGTATDRNGFYFIANLQPGTYDVRATFISYDAVTVAGVRVPPNATITVDIALPEAVLELDGEVVVTAERPLVELDATASVTRLSAQEITIMPTTDLSQVLTTLPSINVEDGQITVRGRTLDEVAFMVDGARSRNPLNHDPYTRINLSAIQELEVITGTFNAEYGEAQSGVINVITKEGRQDRYEVFVDARYTPPGVRHWGTAFYDENSPVYWENTHARHVEWWIENPDQWVDLHGLPGTDPRNMWTPEEAHRFFMDTYVPLTRYTELATRQVEVGVGGPTQIGRSTFYGTFKYREQPPLYGNAYRELGQYFDGNLKVAIPLGGGRKLVASGFYGQEETGWGFWNDPFWALEHGYSSRYAHFDFPGLPLSITNGQSLQFAHALSAATLYEVRLARVQGIRRVTPFPDDPMCFVEMEEPSHRPYQACFRASGHNSALAILRVPRSEPAGFTGDFPVGHNTTGYYFQYDSDNTEWAAEATFSSQLNRAFSVKAGADFSYYVLDFFSQAKFPDRFDERVYRPYQGAAFGQTKIEYGGLIVNTGLRLDFYNPNDTLYTNVFNPVGDLDSREPTRLYAQLSPRLGVSHPIDDRTKLHFSYGHFFQRPPFNAYGEGNDGVTGSLNTFLTEDGTPWVLGNRNLRPQKTIAYEVGLERNFWDFFLARAAGYYKDIRNTIRMVTVQIPGGGMYRTTQNADYADHSGVEFELRKVPSTTRVGTISGYANFTTAIGSAGQSSDPIHIDPNPDLNQFDTRDWVFHQNPRLKLGLYYQTPLTLEGIVGDVLGGISMALDYRANFPNRNLRQDYFVFGGEDHLRSVDQMVDLRLRKEILLPRGMGSLSPYLEVSNLFNQRWIFFPAVERASAADKQRFVESGFRELPTHTEAGRPILDAALYRNLPRAFVFGVSLNY
jgi:outer membrane receptor protein involved in Fe transport